ncbi:MAG TPA: hypothetical protein VHH73_15290 [Verrucomicrobiae bacterium]|nr:hypothetical protein [Verrucomicrobiae bacterium]
MMSRRGAFNIILCGLLLGLGMGCESTGDKKKKDDMLTALDLHLETNPDGTERTKTVSILRASPVQITVEVTDFLDEGSVREAAVVETGGGFVIQILFDAHGRLVLENVTSANRGRRMGIFTRFPQPRWLGAPKINSIIRDGILTFTPDCSREEADRIVKGLNNVAKKVQKDSFFKEDK